MADAGGAAVARPSGAERLLFAAMLFAMGTAWGGNISLAKIATNHGGHPVGLALWQTALGGGLLFLISLAARRPPVLRGPVLRFNLVCGLIGVAFPGIALFWSARYLPAGIVAIAFASMPLFTYVLSALFRVEAIERRRMLGVLLGLTAMGLLVLPESALPGPGLVPWVLLALAASVSMSGENLYVDVARPAGLSSLGLSCGRQLAAALLLAPLAVSFGALVPLLVPWGPLQWAATGMALTSAFAYTLLLYVIQRAGAVFASQTAYLITLAGVLWGILLFDERHSGYIWAALVLMLAGMALVQPRQRNAS